MAEASWGPMAAPRSPDVEAGARLVRPPSLLCFLENLSVSLVQRLSRTTEAWVSGGLVQAGEGSGDHSHTVTE